MANTADLLMQHIRALVDPACRSAATDGQLLDRWVLGRDGAAFAALLARHGPLVWRVGHSVLHRTEDTEDIFQATFLVLARKAATLRKHPSVSGWLYQTAYRLALKARKANSRRLRREDHAERKWVVDPLEEISVREARIILGEEVNRLPAVYREPLLLCLYEGATQDEAARQLGCSVRTVQRRLERARNLLSRRLSRRGLASAGALALTLCSRSELPAGLVRKTIAAVTQFASGKAITGTAAVLAEGVLRAVMLKTAAVYITLLVGLGGLTVAGGFALTRGKPTSVTNNPPLPQVRAEMQPVLKKEPELRLDVNGDPLPAGAVNRIGSNRFRHGGMVASVLYTPDGRAIASTSSDYNLRLWDASTGKLRWRFEMEEKRYNPALAVSSDGKKLAMLMSFEYVEIACDTGRKLVRHKWPQEENADFVRCKAIAPDLIKIARGCFDGTVRIHDPVSGKETNRVVVGDKTQSQFPVVIEFSRDGKTIYALIAGKPGIVTIDSKSGQAGQTLELSKDLGHSRPNDLVLSPMRRLLAAIGDDRVVIWDLKAGKESYFIEKNKIRWLCGAYSRNGRLFAAADAGGDILVFDTAARKEKIRLRGNHMVISLAFSPDGKTLVSGDSPHGQISLWNLETGEAMPPVPESFSELAFANNGKLIVTLGDNLDWWDVTSAKLLRRLPLGQAKIRPSVSPNGKLIAKMLPSGDLGVVDSTNGEPLKVFTGPQANSFTKFSADGTKLFSAGGYFDSRVIIWDVGTGKALHELKSHAGLVNTLAASPNGRWLASVASGYTPSRDYDIRLWDVATGELVRRLTPRRGCAFSIIFSADSTGLLSVGGEPNVPNKSGEVQLWDVETGKEVRAFAGHQDIVNCVAMTSDGRMLASGSRDKTLRLWEIATGMERGRITGHQAEVHAVDFSPNGDFLAAASIDAPVYLWNSYALKSKPSSTRLTKQDREKLWQALADTDAALGFQAICELIAHPREASAILEGGWKQLPRATPKQMRDWVDSLSSDQFAVRKTASAELERFAAAHEDLLRQALKQAGSLEARQRLEKVLSRLDPERLRRSRMLEVLEQLHTAPARRFLQSLAEQTEDGAMARDAASGLKRLERQKHPRY